MIQFDLTAQIGNFTYTDSHRQNNNSNFHQATHFLGFLFQRRSCIKQELDKTNAFCPLSMAFIRPSSQHCTAGRQICFGKSWKIWEKSLYFIVCHKEIISQKNINKNINIKIYSCHLAGLASVPQEQFFQIRHLTQYNATIVF